MFKCVFIRNLIEKTELNLKSFHENTMINEEILFQINLTKPNLTRTPLRVLLINKVCRKQPYLKAFLTLDRIVKNYIVP